MTLGFFCCVKSVPMLPMVAATSGLWSAHGFCGVTSAKEGTTCASSDQQGSWALPAASKMRSSLQLCLQHCIECQQCHFVSISRADKDCSWYTKCDKLSTRLNGYALEHRSFQVRHANGSTVARVQRLLEVKNTGSLEDEGIGVTHKSSDQVCFGTRCVSWAAARAAARAPGGWVAATTEWRRPFDPA